MTGSEALRLVERHGIVLQAARGPVPSLAEAVAGGAIRGSWWAHPKGREIFRLAGVVSESADVLVCRLVNGKITYVHRRLWAPLARLAARFPAGALDAVVEEHTAAGHHRTVVTPLAQWLPAEVRREARRLSESDAEAKLREAVPAVFGTTLDPAAVAAEVGREVAALRAPRTAEVRALRRLVSTRLRAAPPGLVLDVARHLLGEGGFLLRFVAYELVTHHPAALAAVGPAELLWLGQGLDSWESVDTFALYVAGPAWRARQVPDRLVHAWTRSEDRWWRRAALASTVALNNRARGGAGDVARTLPVCHRLVTDRDDMVVKALSWALRELAKRDPRAVRLFLREHDHRLAPRVRREVVSKLRTGLKHPR